MESQADRAWLRLAQGRNVTEAARELFILLLGRVDRINRQGAARAPSRERSRCAERSPPACATICSKS
jgi:hypothetical protein